MDTNESVATERAEIQAELLADTKKIKVTKCVEDTKYPRIYSVHGSIVTCKQTTDLAVGGAHYLEHAIETANMDGDVVLRHAVKDIVIMLRARVLKAKTAEELRKMPYVIDPEDYPASEHVGISKRDRKINMLVEMGFSKSKAEFLTDHPEQAKEFVELIESEDNDVEEDHDELEDLEDPQVAE